MIVTRDRAEGFTLCAFAAARRAKKKKGLVFHAKPAYTAKGTTPTSTVIPTEIQGTRGVTARNGIFDSAALGLKKTKSSPRRDLHSPGALGGRSARSRQSEQRLCNRDQA